MKTRFQHIRTTRNPLIRAGLTASLAAAIAALAGTAAPAMAQPVDCVCASTFAVGDLVVALVDNPAGATGLPAGSVGVVVCGDVDPGFEVVVRWVGWSNGSDTAYTFCECPTASSGTTSDWFVGCDEIAKQARVSNNTQGFTTTSLQIALDKSFSGDDITITAGTLFEDNIVFPAGLDVTVTGAGMDQTIIDGGNDDDDRVMLIGNGQTSATVIRDLTITNTVSSTIAEGIAIRVNNASPTLSSIGFRDCSGLQPLLLSGTTQSVVERCVFSGNSNAFENIYSRGGSPVVRECLFVDNSTWVDVVRDSSSDSITVVSCTLTGGSFANGTFSVRAGATMDVINCVTTDTLRFSSSSGTMNISHSLYPGATATNGNIDGTPTFVDAAGGNYRLAAGSLGIDAADYDAYASAGGGPLDLAGEGRAADDLATANAGIGAYAALDMGAYEFQPSQDTGCPADQNFDGMLSPADFNAWIFNYNAGCP